MKLGVIYARYSSDRQTEQSIEGQVRVCKEFAKENKIVVVNMYIDRAVSGRSDNRVNFQRMIDDSKYRLWDCVLVYKLDRFSRNRYETELYRHKLVENNVKLISAVEKIPEGPEGTLLESLIEGMNQYYSEELAQKSARGLRETLLKGYYLGRQPPFGYNNNHRKLEINNTEAKAVRFIFQQCANGLSANKIAKMLSKKGITKRGNAFANWSINRILHKKYYTGSSIICGNAYNNIYPQIIDEQLYSAVQKQLKKNDIFKPGEYVPQPLRHKLFCGICHKPYTTHSSKNSAGEIIRYYRCRNKDFAKKCKSQPVRKTFFEEFIVDTLNTAFAQSKIDKLAEKIAKLHNESFQKILKKMSTDIDTINIKTRNQIIKNNKLFFTIDAQKIKHFFNFVMNQPPTSILELLIRKIVLYENKINIFINYMYEQKFVSINKKITSFVEVKYFFKALGRNRYSKKSYSQKINLFI